jgi:cytochrome c-550 PedF
MRLLPLSVLLLATMAGRANAQHGDEVHNLDTSALEALGTEWRTSNPYRGLAAAIEIGKSGYNQNCARCHGLEGISGGFAPDLRRMALGQDGDDLWVMRVRGGVTRNGITYMPRMADVLSQELVWAIRSWVECMHVE